MISCWGLDVKKIEREACSIKAECQQIDSWELSEMGHLESKVHRKDKGELERISIPITGC